MAHGDMTGLVEGGGDGTVVWPCEGFWEMAYGTMTGWVEGDGDGTVVWPRGDG